MQLSSWIHRAFSAIFVSHYRLSGFSWNLNCYICRLWDSAFRRTRGTLWCLHGAISWLWTTWKQCCKYTRQLARLDELATEGITSLLCWLFSTSVLSKENKPFKLLFTSVSKRIQVENLSYGNERARLISIWKGVHQDSFWNRPKRNSEMAYWLSWNVVICISYPGI